MAIKVSLLQIQGLGHTAETFSTLVEEHRQALIVHGKSIGVPAPIPKIYGLEACIVRTAATDEHEESFVSDFEIVDDLPPPPTLDEKKMVHVRTTHELFNKAISDAFPQLKRRLWGLTYEDIVEKPTAARSDSERLFQRQHEARLKYEKDAYRHLARLESEIDDLTSDTVDGWKPEPFDILF